MCKVSFSLRACLATSVESSISYRLMDSLAPREGSDAKIHQGMDKRTKLYMRTRNNIPAFPFLSLVSKRVISLRDEKLDGFQQKLACQTCP